MRPTLTSLALGLLLSCSAEAALLDAWDSALRHDPKWRQAIAERDAGVEDYAIGRAPLLPQLNASASTGRADSDITAPGYGGIPLHYNQRYRTNLRTLQLRQSLLNLHAIAGYQQGKASRASADARLTSARQQLAARLLEASANISQAEGDLYASLTAIKTAQQILNLSQRQLKAGEMTRADQARAAARLAQAKQTAADARSQLAIARANWTNLTGQANAPSLFLNSDLALRLQVPNADIETLMARAREHNPELKAALSDIEVARQEVRKNQADHLPTFDVVGTRAYTDSTSENIIGSIYNTSRIELQMNLPLLNGGATSAYVRKAEANQRRAEALAAGQENQLRSLIAQNLSRLQGSLAEAERARADLDAARLAWRAAELGRVAGTATLAELTDAEAAQANAERDLIRANAGALIDWASLQLTLGDMDEQAIRLVADAAGWVG